ncbi:hypothetical protein L596_028432 [Steinernema carpocapsae]|uniref:SANTA domain-containing protein n=1 Tax=Steinernema carpocapsae TaxID=34508 RepID=A0A4U5LYF0_STECR|nr:hypothetical protein L596_028432 [Steinernema carpocapsae]
MKRRLVDYSMSMASATPRQSVRNASTKRNTRRETLALEMPKIELHNWFIQIQVRNFDPATTPFEGFAVVIWGDRLGTGERWVTTPITAVSKKRILQTEDTIYKLVGPMDIETMLENGFSDDFVRKIEEGLPRNWKWLFQCYYASVQSQAEEYLNQKNLESPPESAFTTPAPRSRYTPVMKRRLVEYSMSMATATPRHSVRNAATKRNPRRETLALEMPKIELQDWYIQILICNFDQTKSPFDGFAVVLRGKRVDTGEAWATTPIASISRKRVLNTTENSYKLVGSIDVDTMLRSGFSDDFVRMIEEGLPKTWKSLFERFYASVQSQAQEFLNQESTRPKRRRSEEMKTSKRLS